MKKLLSALATVMIITFSGHSFADEKKVNPDDYMPSLITATPLEGRMLAITIVRKTVGTIQRDSEAKHRVRELYAEDPEMLMHAVELVNMEFKIIAEANNYWRK